MNRSASKKLLLWSLVLLVMAVIYGLSAQTSAESKALSGKTIRVIAHLFVPGFDGLTIQKQAQLVQEWQNIVRKTAHILVYMLLGAASISALLQHRTGRWLQAAGALGISIVYAVSDELHQFFVSGRGPQVSDVLIDAAGALIGIFLVLFIRKLMSPGGAETGDRLRSTQ